MDRSSAAPAEWIPPEAAPALPWACVEASLRAANRRPDPHLLSPWRPEQPRRAATAVVLWGDASGARKLVLIQRGHGAPHHPGELAFPGGMAEPEDRDLRQTARRELEEELGIRDALWELGCFPDGVAKARTRFTPVFFRWEGSVHAAAPGSEVHEVLLLPLIPLLGAPWTRETLSHQGRPLQAPRLQLRGIALWGATAFVLKAWLDLLGSVASASLEPCASWPATPSIS